MLPGASCWQGRHAHCSVWAAVPLAGAGVAMTGGAVGVAGVAVKAVMMMVSSKMTVTGGGSVMMMRVWPRRCGRWWRRGWRRRR